MFAVIIAMDVTTALLAIAVLKPMRRRWLERTQHESGGITVQEPEWTVLRINS